MAANWFEAYDSVGGQARLDTAAIPAAPSAGFWSTNGATLAKAAGIVGGLLLAMNVINDRQRDVVTVRTVPAVTVAPSPLVPQLAPAVTVSPEAPTPAPVLASPSAGFGDLMENVCGNAKTGYRMCRGSQRNAAQLAADWPPS